MQPSAVGFGFGAKFGRDTPPELRARRKAEVRPQQSRASSCCGREQRMI